MEHEYRQDSSQAAKVKLPVGLRGKLIGARLALLWETLSPAFLPLFAVVALFLCLALFRFFEYLPGWLHAGFLAGLAVLALGALWRGWQRLRWPERSAAERRLEQDGGLTHRPISSRDDRLAAGQRDPEARALWLAHRRRLIQRLAQARLRPPRDALAPADPLALRAALVLLLLVGFIVAGNDSMWRIKRALQPELTATAMAAATTLDVWINPPSYTGLPPQILATTLVQEGDQLPLVTAPEGSSLLAQVNGGQQVPTLRLSEREQSFQQVAGEAFELSTTIDRSGLLAIERQGDRLGAWQVEVVPDRPPSIDFQGPPQRTERASLRLDFAARDDYGLENAQAVLSLVAHASREFLTLDLPLPGLNLKNAETTSFHDLTAHPWAGLEVELQLLATDGAGQIGKSDTLRTVIPERIFQHPVARALVDLRKQLSLEPENRFPPVRVLAQLYQHPEHFFNDIVVALALSSAQHRLIHDGSAEGVREVQQLLWDTALRIEEGEVFLAERDLREIQEALMEALARGASDAEIEHLMNQLQEALNRFLDALTEQAMQDMAQGAEPQPLGPNDEVMRRKDLQDLLDTARELAEAGARDAARDLLAQLQQMLENLRAGMAAQGQSAEQQRAMEMMNQLDSLRQRQQQLLDNSFRRSQDGEGQGSEPGGERPQAGPQGEGQGGSPNQRDARSQEQLRRELGDIMREFGNAFGDIPGPLGSAEQEMRSATDALEQEAPGRAVQPQTRAVDQLQQGAEAMARRFMEQFGEGSGGRAGAFGTGPGRDRDPFGRSPAGQGMDTVEGVEIPDQMEIRRAHEIQEELRRRAGERERPRFELDYIERLLRRF